MNKIMFSFNDGFAVYSDMTTNDNGINKALKMLGIKANDAITSGGGAPVYVVGDVVTTTDLWVLMNIYGVVSQALLNEYRAGMVDVNIERKGWARGCNDCIAIDLGTGVELENLLVF